MNQLMKHYDKIIRSITIRGEKDTIAIYGEKAVKEAKKYELNLNDPY